MARAMQDARDSVQPRAGETMADGTSSTNGAHDRGWFEGEDGVFRVYDGYDDQPLVEMKMSMRARGRFGTWERMRDYLDEEFPHLRQA
jgi:hypothetical protein